MSKILHGRTFRVHLIALVFLLLSGAAPGLAQKLIEVSGTVTSAEDKQSLPGTNVIQSGASNGTVTDANGHYKIMVPENAKLVFTFIGYRSQEVDVNGRSTIDVGLLTDMETLGEVVVVGYGTVKKSDLTGSVSSIRSENLENIPVVSVEELFKGQMAGVQATVASGTPGSASNINIRGISSIGASTQPLYVVDGLPIPGESLQTQFAEARTGMDFINPNDIESIEVLKDASATAIYGARGANGVILITTKSGKQGINTITFSSSVGITTMANKIDMMTTRQTQEYWGLANARANSTYEPLSSSLLDNNTDWQDVTSQTAVRQDYSLSFQGGKDKMQYYLSMDYLDQGGLLRYTKYNRYSIRGNITAQANEKLRLDNRVTITRSANDGTFTGGQGGTANTTDATRRILLAPSFRLSSDLTGGVDPETGQTYIDPLVVLRDLSDDIKVTNITEQFTVSYEIIPNLEFKTMAGLTYRFFRNDQYQGPDYAATKSDARIQAQVTDAFTGNYINENTLTYKKNFDQHRFTFMVGNTLQQNTTNGNTINATDFPNTSTGTDALQNASEVTVSSYKQAWQLASFFGRVNYTLRDKYLLTATLRRDGSSKLAPGNKWGTFPSVALGWRISDEDFFGKNTIVSSLKLRASWGQIGNSEIGVYQTLTTISTGTNGFDNVLLPFYELGQYGDANLKWEVSEQTNIGADAEFQDGRIAVTMDVFEKKTKDLLLSQPTSYSAGYSSYLTNVGSMVNRGIELSATYAAIKKSKFQWTVGVNATIIKNKVTSLGKVGSVAVGQTVDNKNPRYLTEGRSIGTFYLVRTAGVWQLGEEDAAAQYGAVPGDWKFVDQNDDKAITNDDRMYTGNALPDLSIGLRNSLVYKKFDLQILLSGDLGGQTLNSAKPTLWQARQTSGPAYNLKAWSPANPTNKLAAPDLDYNSEFLHDGYLEDGDIVRIQNIKLGYRYYFKAAARTSLYAYLSGSNVWSWTGYEGYDPEVGNGINRGIDRWNYPRGRTYSIGLQLTF